MHLNAAITVTALGGISLDVMAENWGPLKDTLDFLSYRIEIVLLTSDLLPNISLVVGQSSSRFALNLTTDLQPVIYW